MAEVTFEYALAVIRALSLEDQARLRQWLVAQPTRQSLEGDKAPSPD
jgi:hypothetical protein